MPTGRILVTGASGLLGANLVAAFASRGERVFAHYGNHPIQFPGVPNAPCDITNFTAVQGIVQKIRPDWIVHCAAATDVDWCELNPESCYRTNEGATRHFVTAARESGSRVVYVSTDAVFDGERGGYSESDSPSPVNIYGRSKLMGERVAEGDSQAIVVRTNIFGFNAQNKMNLVEWILDRLESQGGLEAFADVVFSPLLVNDLAVLLLALMEVGNGGVYHLGSCDHCSKYEFASRVATSYGFDAQNIRPISLADAMLSAPRPRNTWLRTDKASHVLARKMPSLQDGIDRLTTLSSTGYCALLRSAGRTLGKVKEEN